MSSKEKREKKDKTIRKLFSLFTNYKQIIVVSLNNVSSGQVQDIRRLLSKKGSQLIIGKNTVIRKALGYRIDPLYDNHEFYEEFKKIGKPIPQLDQLRRQLKGKVGLIFTQEPAYELKPLIEANQIETAARVGTLAPIDVIIHIGSTGLDPSQISFFHALKISTKIQKGQIELTKEFQVCFKNQIVGQSECTLLQKLDIKPFKFGMKVITVYDDGSMLTPEVVALSNDDILKKFSNGVRNMTALSLQVGIPTACSVPHMLVNAFKNLAALSFGSKYKMACLEQMQKASVVAAPKEEKKVEKKKEEKKPEPEKVEEEEVDMGGLFGDF